LSETEAIFLNIDLIDFYFNIEAKGFWFNFIPLLLILISICRQKSDPDPDILQVLLFAPDK